MKLTTKGTEPTVTPLIQIKNKNHHKATFRSVPKSSEAEPKPNALNILLIVGRVITHFPLSSFDICDFFTPTLAPNSSWVRFCLNRSDLMASPI